MRTVIRTMRTADAAGGQARCAVVTGANTGIGLACALRLAREGFETIATVRSAAKAEVVHAAAEEAGVAVGTELLEVTDADACAEMMDRRRPFALVNNAGINTVAALEDTTDADLQEILEINTVAPMRLARLAVPHMRARGEGRVVNVSSAEGRIILPLLGAYQASKHALEAATATLRLEVARDGIAVCSVAPGSVDTAIYDKGFWVDGELHSGSAYSAGYGRLKSFMNLNRHTQISSDAVARVIVAAILSPRPRPRYLVGADAHALAATHQLLPTALRERLHRRVFAL